MKSVEVSVNSVYGGNQVTYSRPPLRNGTDLDNQYRHKGAIPLSETTTAKCRACGQPIRFRETENGKLQPIDPDGAIHFATCPVRERKEYPDNVCIACGSLNVERGPGAGPHYARLRCLDCQSLRWLKKPTGPTNG